MAKEYTPEQGFIEAEKRIKAWKEGELDLSNLNLTSMPESLFVLTELKALILSNNQLTNLPESISALTALQVLLLSSNQLTNLPESISALTELKILVLDNNQLTNLPENIFALTTLHTLLLTHNQLTSLPQSISTLTELKILVLDNNQLIRLPEGLGLLTRLEEAAKEDLLGLFLKNNPLPPPYPALIGDGQQPQATSNVLAYLRGEHADYPKDVKKQEAVDFVVKKDVVQVSPVKDGVQELKRAKIYQAGALSHLKDLLNALGDNHTRLSDALLEAQKQLDKPLNKANPDVFKIATNPLLYWGDLFKDNPKEWQANAELLPALMALVDNVKQILGFMTTKLAKNAEAASALNLTPQQAEATAPQLDDLLSRFPQFENAISKEVADIFQSYQPSLSPKEEKPAESKEQETAKLEAKTKTAEQFILASTNLILTITENLKATKPTRKPRQPKPQASEKQIGFMEETLQIIRKKALNVIANAVLDKISDFIKKPIKNLTALAAFALAIYGIFTGTLAPLISGGVSMLGLAIANYFSR